MAYQVLARKWRPRMFSDVVGQRHVLKALSNALQSGQLHHAYLFTGTRGVGKTTLARILAKCLNCELGVSASPCNECSACQQIDAGHFVDLIEIDAASRAKVEETRELMDNVQYTPSSGRYKVYLIDEIHMFSNHSFNALLKTLEEPPAHVKFLLATTELKKLPVTVLSRCLHFNLQHLTTEQIAKQLKIIVEAESCTFEDSALSVLAHSAGGSMRDALTLLEQAISYTNGHLNTDVVRTMIGSVDYADLFGLLDALGRNDPAELLQRLEKMASYDINFELILIEFLSLLQRIAIIQLLPEGHATASTDKHLDGKLEMLAKLIAPEDIQLYYQIGVNGRRDLPFAPDARIGFEMILIRMLAFRPADSGQSKQARQHDISVRHSEKASDHQNRSTEQPKESVRVPSSDWLEMVQALPLRPSCKDLALHCVLESQTSTEWKLSLSPEDKYLLLPSQKKSIEQVINEYYDIQIKLSISVEESDAKTPADLLRLSNEKKLEQARQAVEQDPVVKSLVDTFDAKVDSDSIKAI